jgi:hypothetical protein
MTAVTELSLIDAAIEAILVKGAASYSIEGQTYTSLDLKALWQRKAELEAAVAAQAGTSRTLVARFGRAS